MRPLISSLAMLLIALVACTRPASVKSLVTGTLHLRGADAWPAGAVVEVKLVDVSRADAAAVTLAEQVLRPDGPPPLPFALAYDPAAIDPRGSFAVQARVTADGRLRYLTATRHAVLTGGGPAVIEVWLEPVRPAAE